MEWAFQLLEPLAELVAAAAGHAMPPPATESLRWRDAGALLRARAAHVSHHARGTHAVFGADRGHTAVLLDPVEGRVRITCAWDGGGVRIARTELTGRRVDGLALRLKRVRGADTVLSDGRTLEVTGGVALADRLDEATRVVAEVASCGRRLRERAARAGLADALDVEVTAGGAWLVRIRPVLGDTATRLRVAGARVEIASGTARVR